MNIINKINKKIGGTTKEGIINKIFSYYRYDKTYLKKIPTRFMNAYTKNYIREKNTIKIVNNELISNIEKEEMYYNELKIIDYII